MIIQGYNPINEAKATNKRDPRKALMDIATKEGYTVIIDPVLITLKKDTKASLFTIVYNDKGSDDLNWNLLTTNKGTETSADDFLEYVNNFRGAIRVMNAGKAILNINDILEEEKAKRSGGVE